MQYHNGITPHEKFRLHRSTAPSRAPPYTRVFERLYRHSFAFRNGTVAVCRSKSHNGAPCAKYQVSTQKGLCPLVESAHWLRTQKRIVRDCLCRRGGAPPPLGPQQVAHFWPKSIGLAIKYRTEYCRVAALGRQATLWRASPNFGRCAARRDALFCCVACHSAATALLRQFRGFRFRFDGAKASALGRRCPNTTTLHSS